MKKVWIIFFCLIFILGGCGTNKQEDYLGKADMMIIDKAVDSMKDYYIRTAEYKEENANNQSVTYTSGTCEFTLYTDGKGIIKAKIVDLKPGPVNASRDFTYVVNSIVALKDFDMSPRTSTKITRAYRKKENLEKNIDGYRVNITKSSLTMKVKTKASFEAVIPLTVDKIKILDFEYLPAEEGKVHLQARFKNNSDKNLTYVSYTYALGDDSTYLSNYEGLGPGEISELVKTNQAEDVTFKDAKLISISFTVVIDDEEIHVDYDVKTKEYIWT